MYSQCSSAGAKKEIAGLRSPLPFPCVPKLQKQAFSAYTCRHWIIVRAERAGATRTHARSALAGHTRGARWLDTARSALAPMCAERTAVPVESRHMKTVCCSQLWPRCFEAGLTS